MDRRLFLSGSAAAMTGAALAGCAGMPNPLARFSGVDADVHELQERTFRWFEHVTPVSTGLTPDRWPAESFCSIAAVGFALTCWPVGVERGWMTRAAARTRTLNTLRTFWSLPQGPGERGVAGHKGFFYHFLDSRTGLRFSRTELSTVDTTLFISGALFSARYFDGADADEAEIRRLAQQLYERIEWDWAVVRPNRISMGWHPETGFIGSDWWIYNEGMLVLHLAMGSPTHPVPAEVWTEWCAAYDQSWTDRWGPLHLHFAPLFGHQYSHMFVDYRGIQDAWSRRASAEHGFHFDYFENSRRAVEAQRKYAVDNPDGWAGLSADVWGMTACDGPGDFRQVVGGREREFFSYSARGPGERVDGTIAPTAAMASMPFAPAEVAACLKAMKARYGTGIYTQFGFMDSFNPTLTERQGRLQHGRIVPGVGWVDGDYLGIDQGPIVVMIENHRSDLVWRHMRGEPNLVRGLKRAGFAGGWLDRA
jgi:hypothetical protein